MAYVNKQNLSDFWTNAKRYIAARDADQCDWTSVPVNASIYKFEAEPRTPVNPVVEFGFTETPPAEGEKSPENPSTVAGVDSITVTKTGKNLIGLNSALYSRTVNGITFTVNDDGTFILDGTATSTFQHYIWTTSTSPVSVKSGLTYTLTGCPAGLASSTFSLRINRGSTVYADYGNGNTFTPQESGVVNCYININSGATASNLVFKPQLELGSVATAYEPPALVTATVSLGETRYGGTLDVATGKMTVTHYVHVFDGTETIRSFSTLEINGRAEFLLDAARPYSDGFQYCSHLTHNASWTSDTAHFYVNAYQSGYSTVIFAPYLTQENFIAWLAQQYSNGTPVKLIYRLYTPFTIDLDPQQLFSALSNSKVNTIFTDTGTISQLTYAKPAPTQEDVFRYANWHRTETAGIVACCPVPESELHPVVSFSFTETPPESGDKGVDNPSTIAGISLISIYQYGKNLFRYPYKEQSYSNNGVTYTVNSNGSISLSGTASADSTFWFNVRRIPMLPSTTYKLSGCPANGSEQTYLLRGHVRRGDTHTNNISDYGSSATFNTSSTFIGQRTVEPYIMVRSGCNVDGLVFWPQMELNEVTSFELGSFYNYGVNFNNTYYGGSIDLTTGLMTVTWDYAFIDPTISNAFTAYTDYVTADTAGIAINTSCLSVGRGKVKEYKSAYCNRFNVTNSTSSSVNEECIYTTYGSGNIILKINKSRLSSSTDYTDIASIKSSFLTWFENNPTYTVFKLATPFTVQLTPQQIKALPALDKHEPRINTLYTDADSIQVSYQKSPIQTEREITDAILALGSGLGI